MDHRVDRRPDADGRLGPVWQRDGDGDQALQLDKLCWNAPVVTPTVGHSGASLSPAYPCEPRISMTADLGNAYWQGKVTLPLAMAKSKIKIEGNVASLLKLAPLSKKLYPAYIETLEADGREDLIV